MCDYSDHPSNLFRACPVLSWASSGPLPSQFNPWRKIVSKPAKASAATPVVPSAALNCIFRIHSRCQAFLLLIPLLVPGYFNDHLPIAIVHLKSQLQNPLQFLPSFNTSTSRPLVLTLPPQACQWTHILTVLHQLGAFVTWADLLQQGLCRNDEGDSSGRPYSQRRDCLISRTPCSPTIISEESLDRLYP